MVGRIAVLMVLGLFGSNVAIADPETPQLTQSEIDRENTARLQADQARLQAEFRARQAAARERELQLSMSELERTEYERHRASEAHYRSSGYGLLIAGAALGAVAVTAAVLGSEVNSSFANDPVLTAGDLENRNTKGEVYNYVAEGAGAAAGLLVLIAVPLIALNWDSGEFRVAPVATSDTKGLMLLGHF